jgi:coatomer subunit beta
VATIVVNLLINYIGDSSATSAQGVAAFVRDVVEMFPSMRDAVLSKLVETFDQALFLVEASRLLSDSRG